MLFWLVACDLSSPVDSSSAIDDTADPWCDDRPIVTWESRGEGLLLTNCQPCHASTSANRHGAPTTVTFDTEDQALALRELILFVATGKDPVMPPGGGMLDSDRELLETWLRCWTD